MPRSSTGKWVTRAATTGGGRTYRGQVPVNWYAGIIMIVVLGLGSIVFARYEYQHHKAVLSAQPAVGTTLYAGLGFTVCGQPVQFFSASANQAIEGLSTPGGGVLQVSPLNGAEAGNNATLGRFFAEYPGIKLSQTSLTLPKHKPYTNGETCPTGTPDAGKKGVVKVETWPNVVTRSGTVLTGNPGDYKIADRSLITIGFVPPQAKLPRPPQSAINAVLRYQSTVVKGTTTTTSTTLPSSPSTTAPVASTTTTAPSGTTTTSG
jgi:hypothetical protein